MAKKMTPPAATSYFPRWTLASAGVVAPDELSIPNWVLTRIVERQPEGRAFFYPEERIVVVNLNGILPPELSVQVKDVVCENGELRFIFGPSQYRLDKVIAEMGRDPFEDD